MYDASIHDAGFYDGCIHDVMHVSMILDPDTCMYDSNIYPDTRDYDAQCMMHLSMMLDPDTCMYDAYIYVPRPLTLMHVFMMGGPLGATEQQQQQ